MVRLIPILLLALAGNLIGCDRKTEESVTPPPEQQVELKPEATPQVKEVLPDGRRRIVVNGVEMVVGPDEIVDLSMRRTTNDRGGSTTHRETSESKSAGLKSQSDEATQNFSTTPASSSVGGNLPGGRGLTNSSGGGSTYSGVLKGGGGINIFMVFGALICVGGVAHAVATKGAFWKTSATIFGSGLVMAAVGLTMEKYPMVWLAAVGVGLVLVGVYIYTAYVAKKKTDEVKIATEEIDTFEEATDQFKTFAQAIITSVDLLPDATKDVFKTSLSRTLRALGPEKKAIVESIVSAMKGKLNI